MIDTASLRHRWAGHTVVEQLCDDVDAARERCDEARAIIQAQYDALVGVWGNTGRTLRDDFDYQPELNQIRRMCRWLDGPTPPREEER